jgi:hypothetical protein
MGKNPMNAMFVTLGFRNKKALNTLETNLIDVMHARKDF